jgi:hypothetical protein
MSRWNRPPDEGWFRFAVRELFMGGLGLPGDEPLPSRGWLRTAAIGFYVALAVLVVVIVALLIAHS